MLALFQFGPAFDRPIERCLLFYELRQDLLGFNVVLAVEVGSRYLLLQTGNGRFKLLNTRRKLLELTLFLVTEFLRPLRVR